VKLAQWARLATEAPVNQSERIVIGIVVFIAAMVAWASFTDYGWWSPATAFFHMHRHFNFAPFLVLFVIFAMKRNRRWRERQDYPDRPDHPERPRR